MEEQERILMQEEEQRERIRLEEEQKQMELKRIQEEEEKKQAEERQAKMIGNSSNYFDSLLFKYHYSKYDIYDMFSKFHTSSQDEN